jgi:hypothetical protein
MPTIRMMKPTWGLARVVRGYLSAATVVAIAAFAVPAMAQTAGNPVELYSNGVQIGVAANPLVVSGGGSGSVVVGGVFNTTPPTLTNGQTSQLQMASNGVLKTQDSTISQADVAAVGGTGAGLSIQAGAVFNTNLPTRTSGQGGVLQADSKGRLLVNEDSPGTMTAVNVTTAATAGTSSTIAAAATITRGFSLSNNCTTAIWWSNTVAVGTALSGSNAMSLAPGLTFTTPGWWAPAGALTVASQTAAACAVSAEYQ